MVSSTAAPSAIVSEHLNLDNYEYWSHCVKNYLLAEGLWEVVEASGDPPPENDDDAWRRQNAKALHVILISCGSGIFPLISDATSARVAWVLLARKFKSVYHRNRSDHTTVDGGRSVQHEESYFQEKEQVTTGHENGGANVALEEAFGALVDWNEIKEFIRQHPEAVRMRHPANLGRTALHLAVHNEDAKAVEELVQLMEKKDYEIQDDHGVTAFFYAIVGLKNFSIIECLIENNNALAYTCMDYARYKNVIPVVIAVSAGSWEVAECLYRHTPKEALKPENGPNGADIITSCITGKKLDIAWDLIQRYPKLAITEDLHGIRPLHLLASMRSAFLSGTPLSFWQRWIYDRISIKDDLTSFGACLDVQAPEYDKENQIEQIESVCFQDEVRTVANLDLINLNSFDACLDVQAPEYDEENQIEQIESVFFQDEVRIFGAPNLDVIRTSGNLQNVRKPPTIKPEEESLIRSSSQYLYTFVGLPLWQQIWSHCAAVGSFVEQVFMAVLKLLGLFDRVYQKKYFHVQVHRLLLFMAQVSDGNIDKKTVSVVQIAIFRAIQCGLVEFVDVLFTQKDSLHVDAFRDERGRNSIAFSVECRQEKIYNFIRERFMGQAEDTTDNFDNSLLHIAGSLSPSTQLNNIRDAALQMQRELQWFKEMENFVSLGMHERVNYEDNMTGRELFTKNHKELVKEGEKSMKETATSCSVAGALIVTIMFASAFTVVGGNNGNTGLPVLLDDPLFMVFIVSDALSLFSSTTSLMIFLGILTSRYQENDFLRSLPTKMMVGLLTLLFSIATMMVAFSTTLIIMLHDKYSWIVAPIILLACLPITSFVWMQYPLLAEIYVSTYGPGIFGKRRTHSCRQAVKMFYESLKGKVTSAFTPKLKIKV